MKRMILPLLAAVICICCQSDPKAVQLRDLAKGQSFDYYFPKASSSRTFSSLDQAYDFIREAQAKIELSTNKSSVQGLTGRLIGPAMDLGEQIRVVYFLRASTVSTPIDLRNATTELEADLRSAIAVTSVFLVFYGDRAISISDFFLQNGYHYDSNTQYEKFTLDGKPYQVSYSIGWGTEQGFKYLRKEVE